MDELVDLGSAAPDGTAATDGGRAARRAPSAKLIVLGVVALLALGAFVLGIAVTAMDTDADDSANAASAHGYPHAARQDFIKSCLGANAGQAAYCQCLLDGIQTRYAPHEVAALGSTYRQTKKMPEGLVAIAQGCVNSRTGAGA